MAMQYPTPDSSWWPETNNFEIDCSGIVFPVKYMGYTPVLASLSETSVENCNIIVNEIVQSLYDGYPTLLFSTLKQNQRFGCFRKMAALETNMLITKNTITLFYINGNITRLIARYSTGQLSFHKIVLIKGFIFFGFVASTNDSNKRECNVIQLSSNEQAENLTRILSIVDSRSPTPEHNEDRIKSAQRFALMPEYSPFFHENASNEFYKEILKEPGHFLFRKSESESADKVVIVYIGEKNNLLLQRIPFVEMFDILDNYSYESTELKRAVEKDMKKIMFPRLK